MPHCPIRSALPAILGDCLQLKQMTNYDVTPAAQKFEWLNNELFKISAHETTDGLTPTLAKIYTAKATGNSIITFEYHRS